MSQTLSEIISSKIPSIRTLGISKSINELSASVSGNTLSGLPTGHGIEVGDVVECTMPGGQLQLIQLRSYGFSVLEIYDNDAIDYIFSTDIVKSGIEGTWDLNINLDSSGDVNVSFTITNGQTWAQVVSTINTALSTAGLNATAYFNNPPDVLWTGHDPQGSNRGLVIRSNTFGFPSSIAINAGTSNDFFTALNSASYGTGTKDSPGVTYDVAINDGSFAFVNSQSYTISGSYFNGNITPIFADSNLAVLSFNSEVITPSLNTNNYVTGDPAVIFSPFPLSSPPATTVHDVIELVRATVSASNANDVTLLGVSVPSPISIDSLNVIKKQFITSVNGNIGIGTQNPLSPVHVSGGLTADRFLFESQGEVYRNNFSTTATPSSSDDSSLNYSVGSIWTYNNTVSGIIRNYTCIDATAGNANWIALPAIFRTSLSYPDISLDSTQGFEVGDLIVSSSYAIFRCVSNAPSNAVWEPAYSKVALSPSSNPGVVHDLGAGYPVGTVWVREDNNTVFISTDSTDDAAVWIQVPTSTGITSVNGDSGPTVTLDTDDVLEGASNFYYTETRFNSSLSTKTTDDLGEGATNLYFNGKTTSDLTEGTNLYYTDARVRDAVLTGLTPGFSAIAATDTILQAFNKIAPLSSNAALNNLAASKLLGRGSAGAGTPVEITLGTGLSMSGNTLDASTTFTALTDTPSSYSGQALKAVRVNAEATALEFYTLSSSGSPYFDDDGGSPSTAPSAGGTDSIAIGDGASVASGATNSLAIGTESIVDSSRTNSLAIGTSSRAAQSNSISIGNNTKTFGVGSTTLGWNSQSSGSYSIAIGGSSNVATAANASGNRSLAIGYNTYSFTQDAVALGSNSEATGIVSVALGANSVASDIGAISIRGNSSGSQSVAIAFGSVANSPYSIAIGRSALSQANRSISIGANSVANYTRAIALGASAISSAQYAITIGSSSLSTGASNIISIGRNSLGRGDNGIAIGAYSSIASSVPSTRIRNNIVIGRSAAITVQSSSHRNLNSIAIGYTARVRNAYGSPSQYLTAGISIGSNSTVYSTYAIAIGYNALNSQNSQRSISIGISSQTSSMYSIAIGDRSLASIHRTIQVQATSIIRKDSINSNSYAFQWGAGNEAIVMTKEIDLKTAATTTIIVPTGSRFYPNEVGLVLTTLGGTITLQPDVSFGITGINDKFVTQSTSSLGAVYERDVYTSLTTTGESTLTFTVNVAATGSGDIKGRAYFKGMLVEVQ